MRILISNDDGYSAPGIAALARELQTFAEVHVIAPERDRSGASNSLTLDRPMLVRTAANGFRYINGTPTDCVHLAVTGLLPFRPDLVVAGINDGANLGEDTIYSGTVAAATEGYLLGVPAIAFSLVKRGYEHLDSAAQMAALLVQRLAPRLSKQPMLLNVNIPNCSLAELKPPIVTKLGRRHQAEETLKSVNPRGETVYWIGPAGSIKDAGPGTDFYAVEHGQVSVTPLDIDLTSSHELATVEQWLSP
jgi:5'-nucleotidase